jgi:hypothetical protein
MFAINSDAARFKNCWDDAKLEGNDIMVVEGVLSPSDCERCIKIADSIPNGWQTSITVGEAQANKLDEASSRKRVSDQFTVGSHLLTHPHIVHPMDRAFFIAFNNAVNHYSRLIGDRFMIDCDEGYSILRYGPGGKYEYHSDNGAASANTLRTLSALLYLNDSYEGGEIDFPRQKVKIKPKAGMLVMFPAVANYRHASLPIVSGTKYTVVTWFK